MSSPSGHADGTGAFDTNALPACDQKQYPVRPWYELAARAKSRAQSLLFPVASCAHVPPPKFQDSDLRRPIAAWFPGASGLRALSWAHVRVRGAAERGCHTPAWLGIARFARSSYVNRALFGISSSGSELISLSDRILLLVACRPRVRVKRACAVGMARRGAQKGRLGAPCKAGGHCWPLTHGCRCRRAPQIRAMGDSIGRAAPPHERSQPRTAHEPRRSDAMCW